MTQGSMPRSSMPRARNWAVWVLVFLAIVAGILAFLDAARYMGWLPIAALGNIQFFVSSAGWLAAIFSAIAGVIWFMVASWLYNLNPQGWVFVIIIAILNLVLLGLAILGSTAFASVSLAVIVNAAALLLALLPGTQAAFGQ